MPIEYILLGVGIVLLGIEAVVPGFGFFGVTGLISLLAGSYYLLGGGAEAAYILLGVVLALGAVVALLFVYLPAESKWNPFVLWEKQENRHGYTGAEDHSQYLGKRGEVVAPLRCGNCHHRRRTCRRGELWRLYHAGRIGRDRESGRQ